MQQRIPLAAIAPGETVRVAEIRVEGALRRRLFDLGLIPQTLVSCRFIAPAGLSLIHILSGRQLTVIFPEERPSALERQLRTIEWLRAAGLSRGEVFVICDRMDAAEKREAEAFARDRIYLHVGTRAQLCAIVKMGWNDDEAGRTDDSRDGAERPVSEPGKRI